MSIKGKYVAVSPEFDSGIYKGRFDICELSHEGLPFTIYPYVMPKKDWEELTLLIWAVVEDFFRRKDEERKKVG